MNTLRHTLLILVVLSLSHLAIASDILQGSDSIHYQLQDDDKDGVINSRDRCENTPAGGIAIDIYGCSINSKLLLSVELAILFDTGKYDVKPVYYDEIQKISDFLNVHPNTKTYIEGHTDNVGDEEYNQKLSLNRAAAVAEVLVKHFHIDPTRVVSKGYGESQPRADNNTSAGRAENRRVMAEVYSRARHDVKRWNIYDGE